MLIITITIISILALISMALCHPKFGKLPSRARLAQIKNSPNYKNGNFQNVNLTPDLTDGATYFSVLKEFVFKQNKRLSPAGNIPSIKTDLHAIDPNENVLVWFGHSSYYMQIDGKRFLVDPVFCGYASPFSFVTKAFKGSNIYFAEDMPVIDYLFLSHDHWDHLDYATLLKLKPKIKKVICGLGIGEHLERWSYNPDIIYEKDWHETLILEDDFIVHTIPTRHFSGRGLKRNKALWTSFVLKTPTKQIFIGGDSGYNNHFTYAGIKFGAFDLAILENGQYNKNWKHIHLMPDEVTKAAQDLRAKKLLTVHHSKFALSNHNWDEPLINITNRCREESIHLLTPMIGEKVNLSENDQKFSEWWKNIG